MKIDNKKRNFFLLFSREKKLHTQGGKSWSVIKREKKTKSFSRKKKKEFVTKSGNKKTGFGFFLRATVLFAYIIIFFFVV